MTAGGTANTYAAFQEHTRAGTPPHVYAVPQTDTFTGRHEGRSACVQDRWYRGPPGNHPRPAIAPNATADTGDSRGELYN